MLIPAVNYLAVALATISTMVVGFIWYTPKVFGNRWMKLAKVNPNEGSAVGPIVVTVLVSFVSAWVLAAATTVTYAFQGGSFLGIAFLTAIVLWAGFTAARFITHDAFERRPSSLTILNIAHELVTVLVMALIIGLLPPAL